VVKSRPVKRNFEHQLTGADHAPAPTGLEETQPVRSRRASSKHGRRPAVVFLGLLFGALVFVSLAWPPRFNLLVLGIDRTPQGTALGRSDTMVLMTFLPAKPYVGMLSIPRDLWVEIPTYGENRINAAHFFAESENPGTGPDLAVETVHENFGVDVDGYIRIQFEDLRDFVDALGGIPVTLEGPVGKLSPGDHLLDGETALAYVRSREGSDDFFRMSRGQHFLRAVLRRIGQPVVWPRLPLALAALIRSIDSSLPLWQWPRLAFTLMRVGASGIDGRIIDRTMANGFTTGGGAQVLAPDWTRINPVLMELFGQ
jgi:LCP family protein required for cell wall assembly